MSARPFQIKVWQALLTIPYGETAATAKSLVKSAIRRRCARSALRTAAPRSQSSHPVIVS
ncbi:MAG TPA: hypothetical protein VK670_07500 [Silvibacterium sp.]|nr:hypothetical protein [Silvibacterium sp.]